MSQGPFRTEAFESSKQRLHGEVILAPQISHSVALTFILAWVLMLLTWLFTSYYTRKEHVSGWVEPPEGLVRIYPEFSGNVAKIFVKEGSFVQKDDPLLSINANTSFSSGQQLSSDLLAEYEAQILRFEEQISIEKKLLQSRTDEVEHRLLSEEKQLASLGEQLKTSTELFEISNRQLDRLKTLDTSGYLSRVELDSSLQKVLLIKNEHQLLIRGHIEKKNLLQQLQIERKKISDEARKIISEIQIEIGELTQKVAQVRNQNQLTVKAYRSGVVNNLQIREGQQVNVSANVPLLTLLPKDAQLKATLLVPVRSAGFLEKGQPLNIRYDAFPHQKFGIYSAQITSVSQTILLPGELLNSPITSGEPVYIVTADLTDSAVNAYGKSFPLRPGMTFSADITLENRSMIQWLFDPLYSLAGRL